MSSAQETQRHNSESEQRQREQILADCQAKIRKHEIQGDYDRRSIQKLNETIESKKEEICRAYQGDERRRQDHQLVHEQFFFSRVLATLVVVCGLGNLSGFAPGREARSQPGVTVAGGPSGPIGYGRGTPSLVQLTPVNLIHPSRALEHTDAASSSPFAQS